VASFLRTLIGRAATATPVPFSPTRSSITTPWGASSGQAAEMRAMGSVGTLFAIVSRLANGTSQVEWHLYRKAKSGRPEDRVEVTAHAALDLWRKPNAFMPRQEFVETQQQHLDLTGEGWWVVARDPRSPIPLELWPVRPDRMAPVPDAETFISGYMYTAPDGQQIALNLDQVIQLRMPNPLDLYRGMGPVQAILADLDSSRYSAEWNANFFRNSAQPGGILQVDRRLGDAEFDELRMRWNEQHRGVANAHRVAILEQATWVDRKYTQQDMQFSELRAQNREVIREAFGFPKPLLGSVDDVNRANAEAGELVFSRWLIVPRLERIKAALNNDLLPLFGPTAAGLEFDYDNPVPDDRELAATELTARTAAAASLVNAGFDPGAVLSAVGLPAMPHARPAQGGGPLQLGG
jgi:HK97 family phage portal protein